MAEINLEDAFYAPSLSKSSNYEWGFSDDDFS